MLDKGRARLGRQQETRRQTALVFLRQVDRFGRRCVETCTLTLGAHAHPAGADQRAAVHRSRSDWISVLRPSCGWVGRKADPQTPPRSTVSLTELRILAEAVKDRRVPMRPHSVSTSLAQAKPAVLTGVKSAAAVVAAAFVHTATLWAVSGSGQAFAGQIEGAVDSPRFGSLSHPHEHLAAAERVAALRRSLQSIAALDDRSHAGNRVIQRQIAALLAALDELPPLLERWASLQQVNGNNLESTPLCAMLFDALDTAVDDATRTERPWPAWPSGLAVRRLIASGKQFLDPEQAIRPGERVWHLVHALGDHLETPTDRAVRLLSTFALRPKTAGPVLRMGRSVRVAPSAPTAACQTHLPQFPTAGGFACAASSIGKSALSMTSSASGSALRLRQMASHCRRKHLTTPSTTVACPRTSAASPSRSDLYLLLCISTDR